MHDWRNVSRNQAGLPRFGSRPGRCHAAPMKMRLELPHGLFQTPLLRLERRNLHLQALPLLLSVLGRGQTPPPFAAAPSPTSASGAPPPPPPAAAAAAAPTVARVDAPSPISRMAS